MKKEASLQNDVIFLYHKNKQKVEDIQLHFHYSQVLDFKPEQEVAEPAQEEAKPQGYWQCVFTYKGEEIHYFQSQNVYEYPQENTLDKMSEKMQSFVDKWLKKKKWSFNYKQLLEMINIQNGAEDITDIKLGGDNFEIKPLGEAVDFNNNTSSL